MRPANVEILRVRKNFLQSSDLADGFQQYISQHLLYHATCNPDQFIVRFSLVTEPVLMVKTYIPNLSTGYERIKNFSIEVRCGNLVIIVFLEILAPYD